MRTGLVSYTGQSCQVPARFIGRRVWAILKGATLRIEWGKEVIATREIKTDYLRVFPRDS